MPKKYITIVYEDGLFLTKIVEISDKSFDHEDGHLMHYSFVTKELSRVLGKLLTFVDAGFSDERQNKALKDTIHGVFSTAFDRICDVVYEGAMSNKPVEKSVKKIELAE